MRSGSFTVDGLAMAGFFSFLKIATQVNIRVIRTNKTIAV